MAKRTPKTRWKRVHTRKIDRLVARNHMIALGMDKRARRWPNFSKLWRKYAEEV